MTQASEPSHSTGPLDARRKLLKDASGHILARALHVASELQLAELFGGEAAHSRRIAELTQTDPVAMHRLLGFLARHGYWEALPGTAFKLTPLGMMLRRDAPGHLSSVIASLGHPGVWSAFGDLGEAVRTGLPPERGRGRRLYAQPASGSAERLLADSMIGYHSGEPQRVAELFDFGASRVVVDVGGSSGRLLTTMIAAHPHLTGMIFDRPGVEAEARAVIADAGLSDRCTFVPGSFFEGVPDGGDTYILSHIVHDWGDGEAADILASCRRAMRPDGRLLVIETLLCAADQDEHIPADMLLLATTQGRLRSLEQMTLLLERSNFRFAGATEIGSGVTIVEAKPAPEGTGERSGS